MNISIKLMGYLSDKYILINLPALVCNEILLSR